MVHPTFGGPAPSDTPLSGCALALTLTGCILLLLCFTLYADVCACAQKLAGGHLNVPHETETKTKENCRALDIVHTSAGEQQVRSL